MKSYGRACGLALALDQIGERWSLLIVRELLSGPKRFADLRRALDGIASNLLTTRLRNLSDLGLMQRVALTQPQGAEAYALTARGADLRPAVEALLCWGGADLVRAPRDAAAHPHWLAVALPALVAGSPDNEALTIGVVVDDVALQLDVDAQGTEAELVAPAAAHEADVCIEGSYRAVLAMFSGTRSHHALRRDGLLHVRGARGALRRLDALFSADAATAVGRA